MVAPIVDHREGYGVAYGALTSVLDPFGPGSRLSVPATWGGHKRIGLEMEAPVPGRVVDRLRAGGWRGRQRHPYFDVDVDRTGFEVAVERGLLGGFRVNGAAAWEDVRFATRSERLFRSAVYLDYGDYRETPATARRNTVVVRAGIERFATVGDRATVLRPRLDARAYASAGGQAILAARLFFEGATAPLPPYERALLGGSPGRAWHPPRLAGRRGGWRPDRRGVNRVASSDYLPVVRGTGRPPVLCRHRRRIRRGKLCPAGELPGRCRGGRLRHASRIRLPGLHRRGARLRRRGAYARQRRLRVLTADGPVSRDGPDGRRQAAGFTERQQAIRAASVETRRRVHRGRDRRLRSATKSAGTSPSPPNVVTVVTAGGITVTLMAVGVGTATIQSDGCHQPKNSQRTMCDARKTK